MYKMKQDLFEHVASINSENWNIYKLTKEYISSKHIPNQIIDNLKDYIDAVYSKQYEPIDRLLSFFSKIGLNYEAFNLSTNAIGSFIVGTYTQKLLQEQSFPDFDPDELDDAFTLHGEKVSLPDIVSMYNTMNFMSLKLKTPKEYENQEGCNEYELFCDKLRISAFDPCFKAVKDRSFQISERTYWIEPMNNRLKHILPCNNLTKYPICAEYCLWHEYFIKKTSKKELLTMMRSAQPSWRYKMNITKGEINLAGLYLEKGTINDKEILKVKSHFQKEYLVTKSKQLIFIKLHHIP